MRTTIVFSALSDTTTPWRTLRFPAAVACTACPRSLAPAARSAALGARVGLARSCERRGRRGGPLPRRPAGASDGSCGVGAVSASGFSAMLVALAFCGAHLGRSRAATSSRWRVTVRARARSRLTRPTRAVSSSSPVALEKRRPNTSLRRVATCLRSSSSSRSRSCRACIVDLPLVLAKDELGLKRQLVRGEPDRVSRERLRYAGELEHHAPGLDHRHPAFRGALAGPHAGLGGLLRDRLVGGHVDPDPSPPPDLACHRDTGRPDLPVCEPPGPQRPE